MCSQERELNRRQRMKGISEYLSRMIILCSFRYTFPALDSKNDTIVEHHQWKWRGRLNLNFISIKWQCLAPISKENVSSLNGTLAHMPNVSTI